MATHLVVERQGHVAVVTLKSVTMPPAFFDECGAAFEELSADDDLRAVVLRAEGKAFSYGLDLPAAFNAFGPELTGGTARPRETLRRLIARWQGHITQIERCPVPVIAAVHGRCVGGGLDLITACDIRLASADALISLRETKVAIVADLGSLQRLPLIVGKGLAREMAFTGRDVTADEALRMGLVNAVHDTREALDEAALALADEIAQNAPLTVRGVKHVMSACEDRSVTDGLDYVATWNSAFLASEDLGEAMAAFMEKRPPQYKGR